MKSSIVALGLAVQQAASHATFQQLWVNGVDKSTTCVRLPSSNSPVSSVNSNDLRCNAGGAKGVSGKCAVNAGDTVTVEMHQVSLIAFLLMPKQGSDILFLSNPATAAVRTKPLEATITAQSSCT